jgi:hypothetical protein
VNADQLLALSHLVDVLNELEASGLTPLTSFDVYEKRVGYGMKMEEDRFYRVGILDFPDTGALSDVRSARNWFWNHNETVVTHV